MTTSNSAEPSNDMVSDFITRQEAVRLAAIRSLVTGDKAELSALDIKRHCCDDCPKGSPCSEGVANVIV